MTSEKKNIGSYGRDQVVKIINSVLTKVDSASDFSRESIYREMQELIKIIEEARKEVSFSKAGDINSKHIPTATDELDAVVQATADATGRIMDACDEIQQFADAAGGDTASSIAGSVTKIYEACSFQDITGQRITKVVNTLKAIEDKVERLVNVLAQGITVSSSDEGDGRTGDAALLNGPQMPDKAISQDDIDKLLAQFD
jgi:chemotaxis protein CheZ